jgi:upstream activation factor subunit UAF30
MPRTKNANKATKAKTTRGRKATSSTKKVAAAAAAPVPTPVVAPTPAPIVKEAAPVETPTSVFAEQFSRLSELTHQLQ